MNKYKLIMGIILGIATMPHSFARSVIITNNDYSHVISNITAFHSDSKKNNPLSINCEKTDILDSGQSCLIEYGTNAKAIITFKVESKQTYKKGSFITIPANEGIRPMANGEIYSSKDGTLVNFYPSYIGPPNGTQADYRDDGNYSSVDIGYDLKEDGGSGNPNRNDNIIITSM